MELTLLPYIGCVYVEEYQRTKAQDDEYDLIHTVNTPFETQGHYAIDPFEVLDIDGLPFKEYQALFDFEKWYSIFPLLPLSVSFFCSKVFYWRYPVIKEETFATHLLSITREHAWALVGLYDRIKLQKLEQLKKEKGEEFVEEEKTEESPFASEVPEERIDGIIEEFKSQVDAALKSFPEGAFIRLSTRR